MGQSLLWFRSRPARFLGSFGILGCLLASTASAAIVLTPGSLVQGFPDATVEKISVTYDADTDLLQVGIAAGGLITIEQVGVPPADHTIFNPTFDMTVTINDAGLASSATLSLTGNYDSSGGPLVSLTSSTLTGFGYEPTGVFTFLFDDSISTVPGFGSVVGIVLAATFPDPIPSGFGSDFSNSGLGIADVFTPIPEPSTMIVWSICSALAGLAGWRRARRRHEAT